MKPTVKNFVMAAVGAATLALTPSAFAGDKHRIPLPHEVLGIPAPHEVMRDILRDSRGRVVYVYRDDHRHRDRHYHRHHYRHHYDDRYYGRHGHRHHRHDRHDRRHDHRDSRSHGGRHRH